eukprot:SAG22_NODE_4482_length_1256_cov_0.780467_1_plen_206_part_00
MCTAAQILPVPLFVLPGVMASVLYKEEVGDTPDMAMFLLVKHLVTTPGLKGLIVAAMLSALMSTVAGALNSVATLVSVDICKQLRPSLSDSRLVLIGRLTATLVLGMSVGWSTQISKMGNVFEAVNGVRAGCLSLAAACPHLLTAAASHTCRLLSQPRWPACRRRSRPPSCWGRSGPAARRRPAWPRSSSGLPPAPRSSSSTSSR